MGTPYFLRQPHILGLVRGIPLDERYIGQRWLPFQDVASDDFQFNVEVTENPMAPFVSIDAESPRLDGELVQQVRSAVAYIRYKLSLKESDLRIFSEITGAPFTQIGQMAEERRARIERGIGSISRSVDARVEWLRVNALRGTISYEDPQVRFSLTFPGVYNPTPTYKWDTSSGDPIGDLGTWVDYVGQNVGIEPQVLVCSRKVLRKCAENTNMKNLWVTVRGTGAASTTLSANFVRDLIRGVMDLEVVTYDARYTTRTYDASGKGVRNVSRFLPEDEILLLPARPLGRMATSPAPPDFRNTGKFSWTKEEQDPWVLEVGAGINTFPYIEHPGLICRASVLS